MAVEGNGFGEGVVECCVKRLLRRQLGGRRPFLEASVFRVCPLCSGSKHTEISRRMQHGLNLRTVICERCSFVFSNPVPERSIYQKFYEWEYERYYGGISSGAVSVYVNQRISWMSGFLNAGKSRVLEIGSGGGALVHALRAEGADVLAVEPGKASSEAVRAQGINCLNMSLEDLPARYDGGFDAVIMMHVLEHCYDPNEALARCFGLLKKEGFLVMEVPNILKPHRSLDRFFLRYVHPSSFSPETLGLFLARHGFEIAFSDEGGEDDRQPQNLFCIARKSAPAAGLSFRSEAAAEVAETLLLYRAHWRNARAGWYFYYLKNRLRKKLRAAVCALRSRDGAA